MRDLITEGKVSYVAAGLPYFSGPVVAGVVGLRWSQHHIRSDTVNTAIHLESAGDVGEVYISEASYALVKNKTGLRFTVRIKVPAKGKRGIGHVFLGPLSAHKRMAGRMMRR